MLSLLLFFHRRGPNKRIRYLIGSRSRTIAIRSSGLCLGHGIPRCPAHTRQVILPRRRRKKALTGHSLLISKFYPGALFQTRPLIRRIIPRPRTFRGSVHPPSRLANTILVFSLQLLVTVIARARGDVPDIA